MFQSQSVVVMEAVSFDQSLYSLRGLALTKQGKVKGAGLLSLGVQISEFHQEYEHPKGKV